MLRYLIILFVCIYLFGIISNIFNIVESSSLLDTLETYLNSAEFSYYTHFVIHKDYHSSLSTLLFRYPRIHHHLGFSCPDLSYGNSDNVNYSNATRIYNDLLMQRNYYSRASRRKDGNCYSRKEGTYMEHEFQKKIHELIDKITDEETLSFIYKIVVRLM